VASGAIVVIFLLARVGVSIYLLWFPLLLIMMILLTAGLGMFLACANLFSRDVKYLVDVFLTFGILFTAVSYEARMPGKWPSLLVTNPPGALSLPWRWCFEQE
jgi:ABC-type polysaccharide/polyol phosphate export permease